MEQEFMSGIDTDKVSRSWQLMTLHVLKIKPPNQCISLGYFPVWVFFFARGNMCSRWCLSPSSVKAGSSHVDLPAHLQFEESREDWGLVIGIFSVHQIKFSYWLWNYCASETQGGTRAGSLIYWSWGAWRAAAPSFSLFQRYWAKPHLSFQVL